jgi:endonuclease/exonuclease/phosphatase (EEP) superfamily protein YafD
LAVVEFPHHKVPEAIEFLASALVPSRNLAVPGENRRTLGAVSDANIAGRTIVAYNLHPESKGDDSLRRSQLDEALDDARQYHGNMPILLAGDFNLDVSRGPAATAIERAGFQDAFANQHAPTTPHSFLEQGRIIDWVFIRGPIRPSQAQVDRSVTASDHCPLSTCLAFAWLETRNTVKINPFRSTRVITFTIPSEVSARFTRPLKERRRNWKCRTQYAFNPGVIGFR